MAGNSEFDRLKSGLIRRGRLHSDFEFPAREASLGIDRDIAVTVKWKRPWEITNQPEFIVRGKHRFDVVQGEIGNCWFISSVACVATSDLSLLEKCVPSDQSFDKNYAGIFRFQFWQFDKWVETTVDDRLPTRYGALMFARNSGQRNEFWPALVEKAYAKFKGSYDALDGGHIADALCDLTGGISETFNLKKPQDLPRGFYEIMVKTSRMKSMMGCSMNTNYIPEEELGNGLYKGHAYSITGFGTVSLRGVKQKLLRLRNPWGKGEWNGRWSDRSSEWKDLSLEDKKKLEATSRWDEGEFWMLYEDFMSNFDMMQFCHLTPDAFVEEVADNMDLRDWKVVSFHGEWIKGFSAGGPDYVFRHFFSNPQFQVKLTDSDDDDGDGMCTIVVSLLQKTVLQSDYLYMGYFIFKVKPGKPSVPDGSNYEKDDVIRVQSPKIFINLRECSGRHRLTPGRYVIIPTTYQQNEEGRFFLRVLTEKPVEASVVDEPTHTIVVRNSASGEEPLPEPEIDVLEKIFNKHSNGSYAMDAEECTKAINEFRKLIYHADTPFSVETCRSLMAIRDKPQLGMIDKKEFRIICTDLKFWRNAFKGFDIDNSGYIGASEMPKVFKSIGYDFILGFTVGYLRTSFAISRQVASTIIKRYGGKNRRLNFESFVHCTSRLSVLYSVFKEFSGGKDKASLTLEEWLSSTMFF